MAVKAIQAKIIEDSPKKLEHLWLTHRLFNESIPFLIKKVFEMKRGELGDDYKAIYESITSSQNSFAKIEPITQTKTPRKLGSGKNIGEWAEKALEINRSGKILFDRTKPPFEFNSEFFRKLCEMTIQMIHGHKELKKIWVQKHEEWSLEKKEWEDKSPEFMNVLPLFQKFENNVGGKITRRRGRWHLYLDFFRSNPHLAGWKDGKSVLNDFSPDEEKSLHEKYYRKPGRILEAFFDKNPQLKMLDKKYKEYLEYTRPWAKRKYKDGFKHPPTFTLPSPVKHPTWYSFKSGNTYKKLDIENGSVSLRVLTSEADKGRNGEWIQFFFKSDDRLKQFKYVGKKDQGKKAFSYQYHDKNTDVLKNSEIRGIKLIFKGSRFDNNSKEFYVGKPYLVFTCEIEDDNSKLSLKQQSFDKYPTDWLRKKIFMEIKPEELITCAIDLGIRHLGAATIRQGERLVKTKFLKLKDATLNHIAEHKRNLRHLRSLRGKPVTGEDSCKDFQLHVTNMAEDRFKKGAHEIVAFARKNMSDIIILENLKGFIANATYEKGINKAMAAWNRGNLVKWIKQTAQYYGMRVIEVDAFYSSRLCSKCEAPGIRYSIDENQYPKPEWVGKLFACYECGYKANADFNASVNLHKIFYGEFVRPATYNGEKAVWGGKEYKHDIIWHDLRNKLSYIEAPKEDTKTEQF